MKTTKRFLCILALAAITLTSATGCKTLFGPDEKPHKIGLFDYSWKNSEGSLPVEYGGLIFYVKPLPVINSDNIERIETFAVKDGRGLRLILSHHGKMRWHLASAKFVRKDLVIMLDDKYRGKFKVNAISEDGEIVLPGPYIPEEAEKIREKVEDNFKR